MLTNGTPWKGLLRFSVPVFLGLLLQQMYSTVDTIIVGNFSGETSLSAIGTTTSMITLFLSVAVGLSTGAGVLTAQYYGAGRSKELKDTAATAVSLMLTMGLVMTIVGLLAGKYILGGFLDVPDSFLDIAMLYFNIYCMGLVFQFGYNVVAALLRSIGDSSASMYFLLIAAVFNILLDIIMVAGLHMGAAGAAIATDISQALSCIASFIYMNVKYPDIRYGFGSFRLNADEIKLIFRMGLPIVLQQMLVGVGIMSIQRAVNSYGQSMTASYTVASRIELYVQMPLNSLNMALSTYVGQNIGAEKYDRIDKGIRQGMILSLVMTIIVSALVLTFRGQIIGIFGIGDQAFEYCMAHITLIAFAFIFQSLYLPLCGVFQGAGDGFAVTRTAIGALTVRVVTTYVLGTLPFFGCRIVWWNIAFGFAAGALITWTHFFSGKWRNKAVV